MLWNVLLLIDNISLTFFIFFFIVKEMKMNLRFYYFCFCSWRIITVFNLTSLTCPTNNQVMSVFEAQSSQIGFNFLCIKQRLMKLTVIGCLMTVQIVLVFYTYALHFLCCNLRWQKKNLHWNMFIHLEICFFRKSLHKLLTFFSFTVYERIKRNVQTEVTL